jgi:hypothetical protein
VTAQELYRAFMKDRLGPALRARGFRGSAGVFELPNEDHWAILGFQRSIYGDRQDSRFTLNLTVASKAVWDEARARRPSLPPKPAPSTHYGNFIWQRRIGLLLGGEDKWWRLDHETSLPRLEAEVLDAIDSEALPAIRERLRLP